MWSLWSASGVGREEAGEGIRRVPREECRGWRGLIGIGDSGIRPKKWVLVGEEGGDGWEIAEVGGEGEVMPCAKREEKLGEEMVRWTGTNDKTGERGELVGLALGEWGRMWECDLEREGREVTRESACALVDIAGVEGAGPKGA